MEEKLETLIKEFSLFQINTLRRLGGIDGAVKDLAKDFHSGELSALFKRVTTLEVSEKQSYEACKDACIKLAERIAVLENTCMAQKTDGNGESKPKKSFWLWKKK